MYIYVYMYICMIYSYICIFIHIYTHAHTTAHVGGAKMMATMLESGEMKLTEEECEMLKLPPNSVIPVDSVPEIQVFTHTQIQIHTNTPAKTHARTHTCTD
jgi:hypothetical protein